MRDLRGRNLDPVRAGMKIIDGSRFASRFTRRGDMHESLRYCSGETMISVLRLALVIVLSISAGVAG